MSPARSRCNLRVFLIYAEVGSGCMLAVVHVFVGHTYPIVEHVDDAHHHV